MPKQPVTLVHPKLKDVVKTVPSERSASVLRKSGWIDADKVDESKPADAPKPNLPKPPVEA